MKKITIGRGRECDIRLSDTTDKVSRRQAVITVSPTGKMKIYDTSANGTYVNGEKVEKPIGKPIKRGDNINFAHLEDLDWEKVKNPYKKTWMLSAIFLVFVFIVAIVILLWGDAIFNAQQQQEEVATEEAIQASEPIDPDLKLETPVETPTPRQPSQSTSKTGGTDRPAKNQSDGQMEAPAQPAQELAPTHEERDAVLDELIEKK